MHSPEQRSLAGRYSFYRKAQRASDCTSGCSLLSYCDPVMDGGLLKTYSDIGQTQNNVYLTDPLIKLHPLRVCEPLLGGRLTATYQWCLSLHLMQQHSVSTAPPALWLLPAGGVNSASACCVTHTKNTAGKDTEASVLLLPLTNWSSLTFLRRCKTRTTRIRFPSHSHECR